MTPNAIDPISTQFRPDEMICRVASAMLDGRERTQCDLAARLQVFCEYERSKLKRTLTRMAKAGLLEKDMVCDAMVYRLAAAHGKGVE